MSHPSDLSVDAVNAIVLEQFAGSRVRCAELGDNYAIGRLEVTEADIRPGGFISGPTQFAALDSSMWFAAFVGLGRIEPMAMTSELSVRYLRPAQGSVLMCRAVVEAVSRRSVVMTAHVWCDSDSTRTTSTAQGTYAIPLPR